MKEIAKTFLAASHAAPWVRDESARALVNFVYEGGVWDAHAREKYPLIRKKPSREWSLDDVFAYLTFIVVVDRTNEGCIDIDSKEPSQSYRDFIMNEVRYKMCIRDRLYGARAQPGYTAEQSGEKRAQQGE